MKKILILPLLIAVILSGGCASNYRSISPQTSYFNATEKTSELEFSYRYNVLQEKGNKKYAKREDKKGIRVVALKITNNTERPVKFPEDIQLYAGNRSIHLLEPEFIHSKLKQGVPIYLLYLLFTPMTLTASSGNGDVSSTPVGLLLGPGLTALNIGIAASANNKFKEELLQYNLTNRIIEEGETVYGLIGFQDFGYAPLKIELKRQ
jgi:hypothetical protein